MANIKANPQAAAAPSELTRLLRQTRRAFLYAFGFSFCMNVLLLLLPIYSLQVLDRVISSRSIDTLLVLTLIAVIGFIFYGIFNMVRGFVLNSVVEWLDVKLAPRLLEIAVVKSSVGVPTSASQYQRDLNAIKTFINSGAGVLLDAPWALVFLIVIYMISPVLGFIAVIGAFFLFAFAVLNEIATKKPLEAAQENMIQSGNTADVVGRNAEAVEAMGMLPNILTHWKKLNHTGLQSQYQATHRGNVLQSISRVVRFVIQVAVIGVGAWLTLQNELTVGGMIASSILVARALAPFEAAIGVWRALVAARDAYHRLNRALNTTPVLRGEMELPAPTGQLTAEGVFFQPPNAAPIVKNVNFALQPQESLGIIGPSAAGKSTLAKLIIGILPTTHGAIRLDGAETFKWNREDLGRYVGYMPQQVDLFNGTIKDNIARMDMDASDEAVIEAAKFAGCHEMILRLPKGYETEFFSGNLTLSPGQRQRIGLARALYGNPRFVVLDEPNGNLDGEGERALLQALRRMKERGITYIVVAHRPSIVSNVDKILMLRGGMVEAFGPRDEVLKQYVPKNAQPGGGGGQPQQAQSQPQQPGGSGPTITGGGV